METAIQFRLMTVEDIDQVIVVENSAFSSPWTKDAFYYELLNNQFANYIVVEDGYKVIGYCGQWNILDEAHITNVAILPEYRGRKIGEALMRQAMNFAISVGGKKMTLEVRVSNLVAQSLYRKLGFMPGGIRKQYYSDNFEDALVMWVNL